MHRLGEQFKAFIEHVGLQNQISGNRATADKHYLAEREEAPDV